MCYLLEIVRGERFSKVIFKFRLGIFLREYLGKVVYLSLWFLVIYGIVVFYLLCNFERVFFFLLISICLF